MKIAKLLAAIAVSAGISFAAVQPAQAQAQAYPNKPVRMILGFGAGSGTDIIARYLADILAKNLGQPFVVDNRPGANGNIGMQAGAKSPADGYTLVLGGLGVNAMNQFLYPAGTLGFEPEKDFDTVILVGKLPFMIAVGPHVAANNLTELVAAAKAKPGSINSSVSTTSSRMVYELFKKTTGADLTMVPYKTPATAIVDAIGGRLEVAMETISTLRPHVGPGRLKAIAVTSPASSDLMPGVKSAAEQGVPDFQIVGWVSMYMPKGSPRSAINTINAEMNRILALPETRAKFAELGVEAGSGTPQNMQDFEDAERKRWGPLIRAADIKP